ncbi:MAG: non-homologous end-joining DNA ligase [Acidobacteriaceae bacterium]
MALEEYKRKRRFNETPEPADGVAARPQFRFVVQRHRASRLHFDFRLEMNGVLVSWAVPKGPSLDPGDKRLAMHVEDHPISYFHFEGIIPEGNYGAGTVQVWDTGTWEPILDWYADPAEAAAKKKRVSKAESERSATAMYEKGDFKFLLHGEKLNGGFVLAKMKRARYGKDNEWLLIKKKDDAIVSPYDANDEEHDWSVLSKHSLAQIAGDQRAAEWQSNRPASAGHTGAKAKNAWVEEALARRAAKQDQTGGNSDSRAKREQKSLAPAKKKPAAKKTVAKKSAAKKSLAKKSQGESSDRSEDGPGALTGAKRQTMPSEIHPMLATLVDGVFDDPKGEWLYEIKWDGYRAVCFIRDGEARLISRNGNDLSHDFPELLELPKHLRLSKAILDGEICALDAQGRSSFSLMQQRTGLRTASRHSASDRDVAIVYYLFDLLYADGYSLMNVAVEQRKALLQQALETGERFRLSEHFNDGHALFEAAKANQLEGIIAKLRGSHYAQKRSREWLKVKVTQRQECVIAGYTDPKGSRENYGSIVLGLYDAAGELVHVGQAGSGFTHKSHAALWTKLRELATSKSPFTKKVEATRRVHFVKPELVAEIKFVEWTHENRAAGVGGGVKMRAPVFMGLREDKQPKECVFDFGLSAAG